jgi:hypothetical protein
VGRRRGRCFDAGAAGRRLRFVGDEAVRAGEVVEHVGDHDVRSEEKAGLEPECALVVQEVLPPAADDVLGMKTQTMSRGLSR